MENLRRFARYVFAYKWRVFGALGLILVLQGQGAVIPWLTKTLIDDVIPNRRMEMIKWVLVAILGLRLASGVISYWRTYLVSLVGQLVLFDLRNDIFRHLQKLSLSYYEKNQAGKILARVMWDVQNVHQLFSSAFIQLISDTFAILIYVVILFSMSAKLAFYSILVLPLYAWTFLILRPRIRRASQDLQEKFSYIVGSVSERITGAKVVKSFTRERSEQRRFVGDIREKTTLELDMIKLSTTLGTTSEFISGLGTAIILCYGSYLAIREEAGMTAGRLVQFTSYLAQLYGPIVRVVQVNDVIQRASVALERIFEVLDTKPSVAEKPDAVPLPPVKGHVVVENVSFGYDPDKLVLKGISLDVQPGQMIALVGPSGSGKSTLSNLIPRFYDPIEGRILIDGYDLKDVTLHSLRSQIGIVLQETLLFSGTIRDNLRYGAPEATDEELVAAAKAANAHDFIIEQENGYDTEIGERGMKLSGGQKQRLAIARAILRDPRILILDEATSALDSESEALIQEALERLMRGRTTFVVAHRLSTIMRADRIVVLDKGEIAEMGTHIELLENNGIYARLYIEQFKSQAEIFRDDKFRTLFD
ncbi:MAG TPA: ABC transporter ATP-binding protein [Armatimonadota bacterium]|nr:ABC transporter ATP-binding protein [Armatimonadota bacterium]HOM80590.1 ABC transporter ATP-binding protein [Armatimonadota bacterium]HPO73887.1 ABC transporter ATP-binding protein [Armatimonadota bacterium]HPT96833.1 ABC transporter ATP-binding protein [Armatimonadota bacterium]